MTYLPDEEESLVFTSEDEVTYLPDVEHRTPVFAYKYISLDKSDFCFNNESIDLNGFRKYFESISKISDKSIGDLIDSPNLEHRFHTIDLSRLSKHLPKIKRKLNISGFITVEKLPIFGQFEVYTTPLDEAGHSPRIIFFIGKFGVLHLMFYDLKHEF